MILHEVHMFAASLVQPGISTLEISREVEKSIIDHKAQPLFKGVMGEIPFPEAACISINDEIIHGIPSDRKLSEGDIVSIDIGVKYNGWCADAAQTLPVGKISGLSASLLETTEEALRFAIKALEHETHWSKVVGEMERRIDHAGFSTVEEFVGHGIGHELWEEPEIPGARERWLRDFELVPGLVIAIEPMVTTGSGDMIMKPDTWTECTRDGEPAAHFEHTIAITESGPLVLTAGLHQTGWAL